MTTKADAPDREEGETVIYRPYITLRNGQRLYASQCGKQAFRLVIRTGKRKGKKK